MNKSEINKFYNFVKVICARELKQLARSYRDNQETIIVMMTKKHTNPSKIDILIEEFRSFKQEMIEFKQEMIEFRHEVTSRLDKHEQLFKQHGWM